MRSIPKDLRDEVLSRFEASYFVNPATGCWLWAGTKIRRGYGRMKFAGKAFLAHRVAWMLFRGEIPLGKLVCHTCDTPLCVKPDDLFLGSQSDNMADCSAKGRLFVHSGLKREERSIRRGSKANPAKLTEALVSEIRRRYVKGVYGCRRLAAEYGVDHSTIRSLIVRETWRHVP